VCSVQAGKEAGYGRIPPGGGEIQADFIGILGLVVVVV
jgi:hypothetical protein